MQELPVLVVKDRFSKAMITHLLPSKGTFLPRGCLTQRYSVFGLCTVDFKVRSRTCHFGTDKRCEEHFICKRCYMSAGELAKGRCTWHVKWRVRVVSSYSTRTCKNIEGSCGVQDREDDQPQITIVTMVGGVRWYSLHTVFM